MVQCVSNVRLFSGAHVACQVSDLSCQPAIMCTFTFLITYMNFILFGLSVMKAHFISTDRQAQQQKCNVN